MTFGLRNSAQTFQRFIDAILRDLAFTYVHLDDVLIASFYPNQNTRNTWKQNWILSLTIILLSTLQNQSWPVFDYFPRPRNLRFQNFPWKSKIEYVSSYLLQPDICFLRCVLGILNFYYRFLKTAAQIQARCMATSYSWQLLHAEPCLTPLQSSWKDPEAIKCFRNLWNHGTNRQTSIPSDLSTSSQVFIRDDHVCPSFSPTCSSPFKVLKGKDKFFTIDRQGKMINISVDWLKPCFILA